MKWIGDSLHCVWEHGLLIGVVLDVHAEKVQKLWEQVSGFLQCSSLHRIHFQELAGFVAWVAQWYQLCGHIPKCCGQLPVQPQDGGRISRV